MTFPFMPMILRSPQEPRVISCLGVGPAAGTGVGVGAWSVPSLILPAKPKRLIVVHVSCHGNVSTLLPSSVTVTPNSGSPVSLTCIKQVVIGGSSNYQHTSLWAGFIPTGSSCSVSVTWNNVNGVSGIAGWVVSGVQNITPDYTGSVTPGGNGAAAAIGSIPNKSLAIAASGYSFSNAISSMTLGYSTAYSGVSQLISGWSLLNVSGSPVNVSTGVTTSAVMVGWN